MQSNYLLFKAKLLAFSGVLLSADQTIKYLDKIINFMKHFPKPLFNSMMCKFAYGDSSKLF